jgi:hypothetical protein
MIAMIRTPTNSEVNRVKLPHHDAALFALMVETTFQGGANEEGR